MRSNVKLIYSALRLRLNSLSYRALLTIRNSEINFGHKMSLRVLQGNTEINQLLLKTIRLMNQYNSSITFQLNMACS
jgi:hypothetical protein